MVHCLALHLILEDVALGALTEEGALRVDALLTALVQSRTFVKVNAGCSVECLSFGADADRTGGTLDAVAAELLVALVQLTAGSWGLKRRL